jgi:hypothetical protein
MRWDEEWTKSSSLGMPMSPQEISKRYKRQSLGMPWGTPSRPRDHPDSLLPILLGSMARPAPCLIGCSRLIMFPIDAWNPRGSGHRWSTPPTLCVGAAPPCILCHTMASPSTPAGRQHKTATPVSSPIRLLAVLLPWWHRCWCCCCFGGVLVVKWCCCDACDTAGAIYLNHNAGGTALRLQPQHCLLPLWPLWANLIPVPLLQWLWIGGYVLVCDTHSRC